MRKVKRTCKVSPFHIAARIASLVAASEILVSRMVKDLVADSGLRFNGRGRHLLKGLQDAMELYAASRLGLASADCRVCFWPNFRHEVCCRRMIHDHVPIADSNCPM